MKKFFLVVSIFIVSLFVFNVKLNAEELTCNYQSPFGAYDITIVFTDYKGDYIDGENGSAKSSGMYVSSSKGTFNSIVKAYSSDLNYNIFGKRTWKMVGAPLYAGRKWAFDRYFAESSFTIDGAYKNGSSYTCPSLKYSINTDPVDESVPEVIIHLANSFYCSDSLGAGADCHDMVLKSGTIIDENGNKSEMVDDCIFNMSFGTLNYDASIVLSLFSDGTITWDAGVARGTLDWNDAYPIKFTDIFSTNLDGNVINFQVTAADLRELLSVNGNTLTCKSGYVCETSSGANKYDYILTTNLNNCSESGKNNYNDVDVDDGGIPGSSVTTPNRTKVDTYVNSSCSAYLGVAGSGDNIASFLDNIWDIIKVGSILLLIVFGMLDFSKAITNDKEKVPEVVRKFALRLFFLVVILMLPTLIEAIGNLAGVKNVLCGIK